MCIVVGGALLQHEWVKVVVVYADKVCAAETAGSLAAEDTFANTINKQSPLSHHIEFLALVCCSSCVSRATHYAYTHL